MEGQGRASLAQRAGEMLGRAERMYLKILRAVILILATVLLAYAVWLSASSAYKISRSPESVVVEETSVTADELTDAELPVQVAPSAASDGPKVNASHQHFYTKFVARYYALYRTKFEPFRQKEDKQLSRDEFDGAFVNTAARLSADSAKETNFDDDRADLERLLVVMGEAADRPATIKRLRAYKAARKVPVSRQVERTRTSYVSGWDSNSTACSDWYMAPYGCRVRRPVTSTYFETISEMKFPEGTQSHVQIFKAFQDRYFKLLQDRRNASAAKAERERQGILTGIAEGHLSLTTALQVLAGFLLLMFFFLLIAIERHQRQLATNQGR